MSDRSSLPPRANVGSIFHVSDGAETPRAGLAASLRQQRHVLPPRLVHVVGSVHWTIWRYLALHQLLGHHPGVPKATTAAAARRAAARARAAELREQQDEQFAPAAQRHAVVGAAGRVLRGPRLERSATGRSFVKSDPLRHLWMRNQRRIRDERAPVITDEHLMAAERLQRAVERTAEGVGLFRSSVTIDPVNAGTGVSVIDPMLLVGRLNGQLTERREWMAARQYLGVDLWRPIERVVLHGVDVKSWARELDWPERLALGYLVAGLDMLKRFYDVIDPKRRNGIRAVKIATGREPPVEGLACVLCGRG
jgi:hypothetical protein